MRQYAYVAQGYDPIYDDSHMLHCFDYLRQGILCASDTTVEGNSSLGEGWGATHTCGDFNAILEWANGRATTDSLVNRTHL